MVSVMEHYLYSDAILRRTYVNDTALMNEPLSAGDVISLTTPYPTGMMPETPSACRTLRPRSSLYDFASARQISAVTNKPNAIRYAGRLPNMSAVSPINVGATYNTDSQSRNSKTLDTVILCVRHVE